jgi:uncharacterized membrane protein
VVEGTCLENKQARKGLVGSNPTLSAKYNSAKLKEVAIIVLMDNDNAGQSTGWKFTNDQTANTTSSQQSPAPTTNSIKNVEWTASEYVEHEKGNMWFVQFGLASIVIITIVYLVTGDYISIIVLAVLAIGIGYFAGRKPETLNYKLDPQGIHIGPKLYPVSMFKSFAIVEEGAISSIALLPLKRFMPAITVYFAPDDEKKIVDALGAMLPQEERQQDKVDKLMHKIRF